MPSLPVATTLLRPIPASGTKEPVRGFVHYDDVEGTPAEGDAKLATIVMVPAITLKIGHQVAVGNIGTEYPHDGTGLLPASPLVGGNNTLKLASGVLQNQEATLDPRHLLVQLVTGPAVGEVRRITGWASGTQTVTVNRAWDAGALPVGGDKYRLLIDCRYRSLLTLSGEYSAADLESAVRLILVDWAVDGAGALRRPRRVRDLARVLSKSNEQVTDAGDVESANRYPSEGLTIQTRGFLGAKVRLVTSPSSGNVDLFATAT